MRVTTHKALDGGAWGNDGKETMSKRLGVWLVALLFATACQTISGQQPEMKDGFTAPVLTRIDTVPGAATLHFTPVAGAERYDVYRNGRLLITVDSSPYRDRNPANQYTYVVVATNQNRTLSGPESNELPADTTTTATTDIAQYPPDPPTPPTTEAPTPTTPDVPPPPIGDGTGFEEKVLDTNALASEFGLDAESRELLGSSVEVVSITTLRGLRDAGLPEWAQAEHLGELGYGFWDDVPGSELDKAIQPININVEMANAIQREYQRAQVAYENSGDGNAGISLKSFSNWLEDLCTTSWKQRWATVDSDETYNLNKDIKVPGTPAAVKATITLDLNGSLLIDGTVGYRYKKVRTACGIVGGLVIAGPGGALAGAALSEIPYKWELTDSNVVFEAGISGSLGLDANVTATHTEELFAAELAKLHIDIKEFDWSIPVFEILSLEIDLDVDLDFHLKVKAQASISLRSEIENEWAVNGNAKIGWDCQATSCDESHRSSNLNFTSTGPIAAQTTFDLQLIPAADFNVDFVVDVGVATIPVWRIAEGTFGVVAQLPIRLFATIGNNCSDADGDGVYEPVTTVFADVNFEIWAYVRGELFGEGPIKWIDLNLPQLLRKPAKALFHFEGNVIVYERNVYFKDLSGTQTTSAMQPVVVNAGSWVNNARQEVSGVTLSPRSCYPFTAKPKYLVDWGDGTRSSGTQTGDSLFLSHNWTGSAPRTVKVWMRGDTSGRSFTTPPIEVTVATQLSPPPAVTNLGVSAYSDTRGELVWDRSPAADVVGYEIYVNGGSTGVRDVLSWQIRGSAGQSHNYSVFAVDDQGARSAVANLNYTWGQDNQPEAEPEPEPEPEAESAPTTPLALQALRYSSSSGEIQWNRSTDSDGSVIGYRVIRNGSDLGVVDALSRYEASLPTGVYTYKVSAVDNDGNESAPATVQLDLRGGSTEPAGAPDAPPNLRSARYSSSAGEIMWDAANDSDGVVVGYRIVRNGVDLGTVDARSRYEPNLSGGTYNYQVFAVDNDGNESAASTVTLTI